MACALEQTSELFDAWMQHLAQFEALGVAIKLYHQWHTNNDYPTLYVAIEIPSFRTTSHILRVPSCHLTVGTYAIKPCPDRKKLDTPAKARATAERLLSSASHRVDHFNRYGAHLRMRYTGSRGVPKVFELSLCTASFSLDRLASTIEDSFSGNFAVTHRLGIRNMPYLRGANLHVSVYSGVQIEPLVVEPLVVEPLVAEPLF